MTTLTPAYEVVMRVRQKAPLVGCITNSVVTNYTANLLLSIGAAPAMVDIIGEAGMFAGVADAYLVNLGTPTPEQVGAAREAAPAAREAGRPWVLDPVAIGVLPVRTSAAAELVEDRPAVIRGNASEIIALAGLGAGGRGVDASDTVDAALDAAKSLAERFGSVVAISGEVDAITDGHTLVRVYGGSELLTKVTGAGCALGAAIGAFCGVEEDYLSATVAIHAAYAAASEKAAVMSTGPGTFGLNFLDCLANLTEEEVSAVRIEIEALA